MQRIIIILIAFTFIETSCKSQTRYFQPTGISVRTDELAGKNIWYFLNDKESVDGYTRIGDSIFGGEIHCNVKPLADIDVKSFKVLAGTKYARDTNHVYYPLMIPCVDYTDCGVCYYREIVIKDANPSSFQYLSKDYAIDDKHVFFRGELLQDADVTTFKVIDGPEYFYFAVDNKNVYKHDKVFKGADPFTFYYDKSDPRNNVTEYNAIYIIGDKDNEWEYDPPDKITKVDKN